MKTGSDPFVFPKSVLEHHVAVLGKTGSGKTSTAKLLIEQVVADGNSRVCVLDTVKSDWWGVISSADGKRPGLPFHILGGPHGHVPIHESAGRAVAEIVASGELRHSIIDMAEFAPGGGNNFFTDFAPALLRHMRGVLYLVIEEAHELAPKERSGLNKENMAIHFAKKLATAGRSKGIRLLVITQRIQALHNAVLGSCETLIAHRLTAPADQSPVIAWLRANTTKEIADTISQGLAGLRKGMAWLVSGEAQLFQRIEFQRISTYDNTATPTEEGRKRSVASAPVDQDRLRSIIGEAVKEAEANDPTKLKRRIAELERELARKPVQVQVPGAEKTITKRVEVPVVKSAVAARVESAIKRIDELGVRFGDSVKAMAEAAQSLAVQLRDARREGEPAPARPAAVARLPQYRPPPPARAPKPAEAPNTEADVDGIGNAHQRVLDSIAWWATVGVGAPDKGSVAFIAGYTVSGNFKNLVGTLRTHNLIEYPDAGKVRLTSAGEAAANYPERPGTLEDLHDAVRAKLRDAQLKLLNVVIAEHPRAMTKEELAERAGYTVSGNFKNILGSLRSLGLVTKKGPIAATPLLFPEALAGELAAKGA